MKKLTTIIFTLIFFAACQNSYTPKPQAYFRISFPEKIYKKTSAPLPYSFEYPIYAHLTADTAHNAEEYWNNLLFPQFNASVHITYKRIENNLPNLLEDARTMAFKHTVKADAIDEQIFVAPEKNVSGLMYTIKGNTASQVQFYLTDSSQHFLRGALYFNVHPNKDSLSPVVKFISQDIVRLMESLQWETDSDHIR